MSDFEKLYENLKECVDSDNDSFIGVTEDGVEFNMYEYAFILAVGAKREFDTLRQQNAELAELVRESFIEGCRSGYSSGLNYGQSWSSSNSTSSPDEDWAYSDSKELLSKIKGDK